VNEQTEGEREHERRIRKEAIKLGLIDLGPRAVHTTVTDTRDLRDPHTLGREVIAHAYLMRNGLHGPARQGTLSSLISSVDFDYVEDYSHDETNVQTTIDTYRSKMQKQAAEGDVYALRVLLDKAWEVPSDVDQALLERAREMHSADDEVVE